MLKWTGAGLSVQKVLHVITDTAVLVRSFLRQCYLLMAYLDWRIVCAMLLPLSRIYMSYMQIFSAFGYSGFALNVRDRLV
jgi:hypothetical protein